MKLELSGQRQTEYPKKKGNWEAWKIKFSPAVRAQLANSKTIKCVMGISTTKQLNMSVCN